MERRARLFGGTLRSSATVNAGFFTPVPSLSRTVRNCESTNGGDLLGGGGGGCEGGIGGGGGISESPALAPASSSLQTVAVPRW